MNHQSKLFVFATLLTSTAAMLAVGWKMAPQAIQSSAQKQDIENKSVDEEVDKDELAFDQNLAALRQLVAKGDNSKIAEMKRQCDEKASDSNLQNLANAWKGSTLIMESQPLFQAGNWQAGLKPWNEGLHLFREVDKANGSVLVSKRIAFESLAVWSYEQDPKKAIEIAQWGVDGMIKVLDSRTNVWTKLPLPLRLQTLSSSIKAAIKIEDPVSEKRFLDSMIELAPDDPATMAAKKLVVGGKELGNSTTQVERFDMLVREDFFDGVFENDREAFDRAMNLCKTKLKEKPDDSEAMVWLGSGLLFESGSIDKAGNEKKAAEAWDQGITMMHKACASAPDDINVLIPRAATLIGIGRIVKMKESERIALLNLAVYDYEHSLDLQKSYFDNLSSHARGELLFGLADGWHQLNNSEKANSYFNRVIENEPDSEQAKLSKLFLEGKLSPAALKNRNCAGCH